MYLGDGGASCYGAGRVAIITGGDSQGSIFLAGFEAINLWKQPLVFQVGRVDSREWNLRSLWYDLGVTIQPPFSECHTPRGFKELIRTIWSLMRPNRVLNLGGLHFGGAYTPNS